MCSSLTRSSVLVFLGKVSAKCAKKVSLSRVFLSLFLFFSLSAESNKRENKLSKIKD